MMHFLSDSNETFKDLTQEEYPFAFMLACGGFLLTMLADCVISYVFLKNKSVVSAADLQVQGNTKQGKGGQYGTQSHTQNTGCKRYFTWGQHLVDSSLVFPLCV
ncbi:hypothetical protein PS1_030510 [Malus domestica]